ncbi:MAG: hypothetical protein ACRDOO_26165 [Actinomadura sp.]
MSCEHLICARCSGPVVEGRCPTCRAARAEIHRHGLVVPPAVLFLALALAALLLLALRHVS